MSLVEINAKEAEEKLQVATKFHLVIISIVFGAVSFFLYNKQDNSQKEFTNYIIKQNELSQKISSDLTKIITENTIVLEATKKVLEENKIYIKPKK